MVRLFSARLMAVWVVVLGVVVVLAAAPVAAQGGDTCAATFLAAADQLVEGCNGMQAGMICAGPAGVSLRQAATGAAALAAGVTSLAESAAVELASTAAEPAIAVLQLPALEEGRSLTAVVWGTARIDDAPAPPRAPACEARSLGSINVRSEPSTAATILGQLEPDQRIPILARLEDATWWRIAWNGDFAWVFAELTPSECDPEIMLVYDPDTGAISGGLPTPEFQAVQLMTGLSDLTCPAALQGGALVQSPGEGVSWLLNGMRVYLDGTIWVQAPLHDALAIQVLEGQVAVETGPVSRVAGVGQMLRVPLRDGQAEGVPGPVLDGVSADVAFLPLMALPRAVEPPAASVPAAGDQAAVQCSPLPQLWQLIPDGTGTAAVDLVLDTAQVVRVSATGAGLSGLAVGEQSASAGSAGEDFRIMPGVSLEAGTYRVVVTASGSQLVTLGVTCDLPVVTVAQEALTCEDLLLRWGDVQGGSVQFSTSGAARASAVVTHALPSEGPAQTLGVADAAGDVLAQAPFAAVSSLQVAGPLVVDVSEAGIYRVEWDGDPFNVAAVEVVCELLPPAEVVEE